MVDTTNTLSEDDAEALRARIAEVEAATRAQLAVLIVSSTREEDIAPFALRVFEAWKPGDARRDDGLLVVVALADRRMRIEVGQGLEGTVPDLAAARIVDHLMAPRFRERDYAGGLRAAIDALDRRLRGEAPSDAEAADAQVGPSLTAGGWTLLAVLLWSLGVGAWHARSRSRWPRAAGLAALGPVAAGVAHLNAGIAIAGAMVGFWCYFWGRLLAVSRLGRWLSAGALALIAVLAVAGRTLGADTVGWGLLGTMVGGAALAVLIAVVAMMRTAWRKNPLHFALLFMLAAGAAAFGIRQVAGALPPTGAALAGAGITLAAFLVVFMVGLAGWSRGGAGGRAGGRSDSDGGSSWSSSSGSSSSGGGGSSSGGGASGSW